MFVFFFTHSHSPLLREAKASVNNLLKGYIVRQVNVGKEHTDMFCFNCSQGSWPRLSDVLKILFVFFFNRFISGVAGEHGLEVNPAPY